MYESTIISNISANSVNSKFDALHGDEEHDDEADTETIVGDSSEGFNEKSEPSDGKIMARKLRNMLQHPFEPAS